MYGHTSGSFSVSSRCVYWRCSCNSSCCNHGSNCSWALLHQNSILCHKVFLPRISELEGHRGLPGCAAARCRNLRAGRDDIGQHTRSPVSRTQPVACCCRHDQVQRSVFLCLVGCQRLSSKTIAPTFYVGLPLPLRSILVVPPYCSCLEARRMLCPADGIRFAMLRL